MIRTVITPEQQSISIDLPENYIGKKVEVIAFTVDEATPAEDTSTASMADFFGTISPENAESLHQHIKQARNEWDRDF